MATAPVFLISLFFHALVGGRVAPDLALTAPWLSTALWAVAGGVALFAVLTVLFAAMNDPARVARDTNVRR